MGLLSLEPFALRLKELEGTPAEKLAAKKILPVVQRHHHLLVALLLVNAGANEALPIFLDRIVDARSAARKHESNQTIAWGFARGWPRFQSCAFHRCSSR